MGEKDTITAILGSPRRGGNSDSLAMEFLKGAASRGYKHSLIIPTDLMVSPCDGGNQCFADGNCVIRDGMNQIYEKVLSTNHLLLATPVYFMGPPGSLKVFIDRFQAVWARSAILKSFHPDSEDWRASHKAFVIIAQSVADKPNMHRPAMSIIRAFLNVIGFTPSGELIATGLEEKEAARKHDDLLKEAFAAGITFVTGEGPQPDQLR